MKCPLCGAYLSELDAHCPKCGAEVWSIGEIPAEMKPKTLSDAEAAPVPEAGADAAEEENTPLPLENETENTEEKSLKWYKFLIYFALFALCAFFIYRAVCIASGKVYFDAHTAGVIYTYYPDLETVNLFLCVVYVFLAGFSIVTRRRLAARRKNAPVFCTVLFAMCAVLPLITARLSSNATGIFDFRFLSGAACVFWAAAAFFNYYYFQNRRDLFTE